MEKKLNIRRHVMLSLLFAAVFAIYNIIVMLVFDGKNNIFWISYSFMCAAFVIDVAVTMITVSKLDAEAAFLGIPLMSFSLFYFFAELFVSFVFMLFRNLAGVKLTVALQTILLLVYVIFAAFAILSRDAVVSITKGVETKVQAIKMLSVDVAVLEEQCMDKELKAELHKVAEAIKYSDPMTNDAIAPIDAVINGKVAELKILCNDNDKNSALQTCYQLESYISERNKKLILTK